MKNIGGVLIQNEGLLTKEKVLYKWTMCIDGGTPYLESITCKGKSVKFSNEVSTFYKALLNYDPTAVENGWNNKKRIKYIIDEIGVEETLKAVKELSKIRHSGFSVLDVLHICTNYEYKGVRA